MNTPLTALLLVPPRQRALVLAVLREPVGTVSRARCSAPSCCPGVADERRLPRRRRTRPDLGSKAVLLLLLGSPARSLSALLPLLVSRVSPAFPSSFFAHLDPTSLEIPPPALAATPPPPCTLVPLSSFPLWFPRNLLALFWQLEASRLFSPRPFSLPVLTTLNLLSLALPNTRYLHAPLAPPRVASTRFFLSFLLLTLPQRFVFLGRVKCTPVSMHASRRKM